MRIFTYFEPILEHYKQAHHGDVVDLWRESWEKLSCPTTVLSRADAERNPIYQKLRDHISTFPTLNNRQYEEACFVRWCAAQLAGDEPFVFMDYDIFPTALFQGWPEVNGLAEFGAIPSCVMGKGSHFTRFIQAFLEFQPSPHQGHMSDMGVIYPDADEYFDQRLKWCRCYGEPHWRDMRLVHFANWTLGGIESRADVIRGMLDGNGKVQV